MAGERVDLYIRIDYVKPTALDLGSVAAATGGGPCMSGGSATTTCTTNGQGAADACNDYGTTADLGRCSTGSSPLG